MDFDKIKTRKQAIRFLQARSLDYEGEYLFAFKQEKCIWRVKVDGERIEMNEVGLSEKLAGADVFHSHPATKTALKTATLSWHDIEACMWFKNRSVTAIVGRHLSVFFNCGQFKDSKDYQRRVPQFFVPAMEIPNASMEEAIAAMKSQAIPGVFTLILDK